MNAKVDLFRANAGGGKTSASACRQDVAARAPLLRLQCLERRSASPTSRPMRPAWRTAWRPAGRTAWRPAWRTAWRPAWHDVCFPAWCLHGCCYHRPFAARSTNVVRPPPPLTLRPRI
mmetsp:Transcript_42932/g.128875  ORF Transcript_42932/g.128875 Transcript_42932/m.128875 type:complete len:118 (+) Transcript_42932:1030-1383(+)